MGGIGLQQGFIFLFLFMAIKFHRDILREDQTNRTRQALRLLYVLYAALFLITVSPSDRSTGSNERWCFPILIA